MINRKINETADERRRIRRESACIGGSYLMGTHLEENIMSLMESMAVKMTRRSFTQALVLGGTGIWLNRSSLAAPGGMFRFEARGNPFLRGKQQGEACAKLFRPWLERTLDEKAKRFGFTNRSGLLRGVQQEVDRWRGSLEELSPDGSEECRGLIAGLGVDQTAFFTAHFIHLVPPGSKQSTGAPLCTVVGTRDAQGRPLVGKTDDVGKWELGMNVLEVTWPEKGYRHAHFHFAGTIWTVAGMNEHGLAMGMNGIPSPTLKKAGIPTLEALHTILPACASVGEAIEHIRRLSISAGGFSLLLGDSKGELAVVERTAAGTAVLPEKKGKGLAHTNHILDSQFAKSNPKTEEPMLNNSLHRYENVLRLLEAGEGIEPILNNQNSVGAICQRGQADLYTDFGVVFSPVEMKLKFWSGYPGEIHTETLNLKTTFG